MCGVVVLFVVCFLCLHDASLFVVVLVVCCCVCLRVLWFACFVVCLYCEWLVYGSCSVLL